MRLHARVNVCAGVHQQTLPDVLDRERGFIGDVKFVEALGNDLVKILIEELHHARYCLIEGEHIGIIHCKEARDSSSLVLPKLGDEPFLEFAKLQKMLLVGNSEASRIAKQVFNVEKLLFQRNYILALVEIKTEAAHHLVDAVSHIKLVHAPSKLGQVCLIKGCLVERVLNGHPDEICI